MLALSISGLPGDASRHNLHSHATPIFVLRRHRFHVFLPVGQLGTRRVAAHGHLALQCGGMRRVLPGAVRHPGRVRSLLRQSVFRAQPARRRAAREQRDGVQRVLRRRVLARTGGEGEFGGADLQVPTLLRPAKISRRDQRRKATCRRGGHVHPPNGGFD